MKKKFKILLSLSLLTIGFLSFVHFGLAQQDLGLEAAAETGLTQDDPRIIAARVIRIIMGFLGIISIGLITYAGWLYTTSQGDEEKITKAKAILKGAVIGLVITLSAFAIASFIISSLLNASKGNLDNYGGGNYSGSGGRGTGGGGAGLKSCDGDNLTSTCEADSTACSENEYCDSDCYCRSKSGYGESCDSDPATASCEANQGICSTYLECKSDTDCLCLGDPVIEWISPVDENNNPNGAPGNLVTIGGLYFGDTPGKVYFWDGSGYGAVAAFPDSVNPECTSFWRSDQIIVVVPQGAKDGPIKVVSADNREDATEDDRGPWINDFDVNDIKRPGLCLVNPSEGYFEDQFKLSGVSLNGTNKEVLFGNEKTFSLADNASSWSNLSVNASVPNISSGKNTIFVKTDDLTSNYLRFEILSDEFNNPVIEYIDPAQGPAGQYITIYGRNFKSYDPQKSLVQFYLPADEQNLISADIDFPQACQGKWWKSNFIIVKVPGVGLDNYKVVVTNKDGRTSAPADFGVTSDKPTPGVCLLDPRNGPVGTVVNAHGDSFKNEQGSGKAIFYNNKEGAISGWAEQNIKTSVPSGSQTGPFKVNQTDNFSNSLPFTVGSCSSNDECETSEECCASGTQWAGICRDAGTCNQGAPGACEFGWTFFTSPLAPETCAGFTNVEACLGAGLCPNSPGTCQTSANLSVGGCGNDFCNEKYDSKCNGQCTYSTGLNSCILSGETCDQDKIFSGYNAECSVSGGQSIWQIDTKGMSCPAGSFLNINGKCTVGSPVSPQLCNSCDSGFVCKSGQCAISSPVCPSDSTCDVNTGECKKEEGACECCCRVGQDEQDCCSGLNCEAGGCGAGAPDYGVCTGCRVELDGSKNTVTAEEQAVSDQACQCTSKSRYCELNDTNYPSGVCRDKTDDSSDNKDCLSSEETCSTSCCAKSQGGCDSLDNNTCEGCAAGENLCDSGECCGFECQGEPGNTYCPGGAGELCKIETLPACAADFEAETCAPDYDCLNKDGSDCRCCCVPGSLNGTGLQCLPDKGPCDGSDRGLFCGCTSDLQCGSTNSLGCSFDSCCRARPEINEVSPGENASGVCRNALIKATLDQPMDTRSFTGNIIVVGDYGSEKCPAGTQYLVLNNPSAKEKIIGWLTKIPFVNKIFTPEASAVSGNFCAITGKVEGYNTKNEGVMTFATSQAFEAGRKYYVIVKGDKNINDATAEGVISWYEVGMKSENYDKFNAIDYSGKIWSFTAGNNICEINSVSINPASYLFTTSQDDTSDNDPSSSSYDSKTDSDKIFNSFARSANGQEVVSINGLYSWAWSWLSGNSSIATVSNSDNWQQKVVAQNKQDAETYIKTTATIKENTVNPSDVGKTVSGEANVYVLLCENPWPSINSDGTWSPWEDCVIDPSNCDDFNYKLYYCRDAGGVGTADDLPAISTDAIVVGGSENILKEFYFLREETPSASGLSLDLSDQTETQNGRIYAEWSTLSGASGYKLYYGTTSGNYTKFIDVKGGSTAGQIVSGLNNGVTYYFAVTAYYSTGAESIYSSEKSIIPTDDEEPARVSGLSVVPGDGQLELSWNKNTDDTINYKVYYGTSSGLYGVAEDVGNVSGAVINGLTNSVTYYVVVTAVDAYGNESLKSDEVNKKPNQ